MMRNLWLKLRLPGAIICILILTLAMARLFSGPEDTWIKNDSGEWVKHGHPYGPPPAGDFQEPRSHLVLPLVFLASFIVPLLFISFHKLHNCLSYEKAKRDVKIMGYLSTSLPLLGILIMIGMAVEIGLLETVSTFPGQNNLFTLFLVFSLAGFSGFCILIGVIFYAIKRKCNDHYHLVRSYRELLEALENRSEQ